MTTASTLLPPESSDFARLDELRKLMINARAQFHGLVEDLQLMVEAACVSEDNMKEMIAHRAVAAAVYVHAIGRYTTERDGLIDRLSTDDPRRAILGVEVVRRP
jgi:hypothetical protein